jgi:hypothetical protein
VSKGFLTSSGVLSSRKSDDPGTIASSVSVSISVSISVVEAAAAWHALISYTPEVET